MNLRVLAILLILLPALRGVGYLSVQASGNDHTLCCKVVEVVSCCGEVSLEEICSQSVSDCDCVAAPGDLPFPSPTPILPLTLGDLILDIPEPTEVISITLFDDQSASINQSIEQSRTVPTHNQAQAILGIWRL